MIERATILDEIFQFVKGNSNGEANLKDIREKFQLSKQEIVYVAEILDLSRDQDGQTQLVVSFIKPPKLKYAEFKET